MRGRLQTGFTLIEVMIVVAIVAILTSIALPQYTDYMRRGRISEAVGILSSQRIRMEQYFQDRRSYLGACVDGTVAPSMGPPTSSFSYDCNPAPDATTYRLRAQGIGSLNGFIYTIDQAGVRTTTIPAASGWAGTGAACWVLARDGRC